MPIDLYHLHGSPPCRAVLITAKLVGVEFNKKSIDLEKGDHLKPEFIKLNPMHTIPTLVDNETTIIESRAIMTYLVNQYAKNDSLYPKDPRKRALVDQRLYFDNGTLYARLADYYYTPLITKTDFDPAKMEKVQEALQFLNTFLENSQFVAGDNLSLADITIYVTITSLEACKLDLSSYKNITKWLPKVEAKLNFEEDKENLKAFKDWYDLVTIKQK